MKRVTLRVLDHTLVSFWTMFAVVSLYGITVMVVRNDWSLKPGSLGDAFEWLWMVVCTLTAPRLLPYWGISHWFGWITYCTALTVIYLFALTPGASLFTRLTTASSITLIVTALAAPILAKLGWVPRIRWPNVVRSRGEHVKRQQELRAAQEELARLASEQ